MTSSTPPTTRFPLGYGPDMAVVTRVIVRELEQTILPDLQSERARTMAGMMVSVLRHQVLILEGRIGPIASADLPTQLVDGRCVVAPVREQIQAELAEMDAVAALEAALPLPTRKPEQVALLDVTPQRLTPYLNSRDVGAGMPVVVARVNKLLSGFSKETFLIEADIGGVPSPLVLRRDASNPIVETSVKDEYPLLLALHPLGLAVPEPVLLETDPSIFGEPFTITKRAKGETFANTKGMSMGEKEVAAARGLAEFLATLHRVTLSQLDLGARGYDPQMTMEQHILREIDYAEAGYRRFRREISPTLEAGFAWLRANIPDTTGEEARIVHGDAGLHNLMVDEGKTSVMLDWELTHAGDPVEDLAYSRTWVDQVLPWDEFLAIYYKNGGPPYKPEREAFYGNLADIRVTAIWAEHCVYNFTRAEHPELPWAFAATFYHRYFAKNVAQRLLAP